MLKKTIIIVEQKSLPLKKMVYKKYVYKRGRRHGPYYYHSYRDGNSVKKVYIGGKEEYKEWLKKREDETAKEKSRTTQISSQFIFSSAKKTWFLLIAIVLLIIFGLFIYQYQITGKVSFNIQNSYISGENISGNLKLSLKEGELLPIDSKLIINQNEVIKEIPISDFIHANSNGSFYIENKELSGQGEGYGFQGKRETYPTVFFTLNIYDKGTEEIKKEETTEEVTEKKEVEEIQKPIEEPTKEEKIEELEEVETEPAETEETTKKSVEVIEELLVAEPETSPLTGEVVKETAEVKSIEGSCSKDRSFVYQLEEGKTAEIKKNSVEIEEKDEEGKIKREKINDNEVSLEILDGELEVTTAYSTIEEGFGKDFLGEEEEYVEIDLKKSGIEAEQGTLKISLVYENIVLAEVSEEISVISEIPENITKVEENISGINITFPEVNITEIENITIINKTITNVTEINITIINKTITNVTLVNLTALNITTRQHKAVIGKPVKWIKTIKIENLSLENLTLELPKQAVNITIKTGAEIEEALEEIGKYEQIINKTDRKSLITGQVTGDVSLEIKKSKGVLTRFWNWLTGFTITGKVIEEQEIEKEIIEKEDRKEINLDKIINETQETEIAVEYYTDAPKAEETNISVGKRLVVSAPDELNYTDVLAYTLLDNRVSVNETEKIRLYWVREVEEVVEKAGEKKQEGNLTEATNVTEVNVNEVNVSILNETVNISEVEISLPEENVIVPENVTEEDGMTEINITKEANFSLINETAQEKQTAPITAFVSLESIEGTDKAEKEANASENVIEIKANQTIKTKELVNFTAYDLDENGFIDYIEWLVPYLSNQTYEIIYITKAEHLDENRSFIADIYEQVKEKDDNWKEIPAEHYVRVTFEQNLTKEKDITIYARMKNDSIVVNGTEVPYELYQKKKRIDEIKRVLENER